MLGLAKHCLVEPGLPCQGYKNIGITGRPGKDLWKIVNWPPALSPGILPTIKRLTLNCTILKPLLVVGNFPPHHWSPHKDPKKPRWPPSSGASSFGAQANRYPPSPFPPIGHNLAEARGSAATERAAAIEPWLLLVVLSFWTRKPEHGPRAHSH
jgi:hypothetical protein